MANGVRKRTYQTDKTRAKIKTARILNRIQCAFLGQKDPVTKQKVTLTTVEAKLGQILLNKVLPDLTQADITTHGEKEPRTAEEIRLELVKSHGETIASLLLNEITDDEFIQKIIEIKGYTLKPMKPVKAKKEIPAVEIGKGSKDLHEAKVEPNLTKPETIH